jgi:hypothetical protein
MQFRCWKFWFVSVSIFLVLLLIVNIFLGLVLYKFGICVGMKEGYRYGWYDRHLRIPYVQTMKCGQYWKHIEKTVQEDWNQREKTNGLQEIF